MSDSSRNCHCVICHDYADRDDYDAADHGVIENVEKFGWSVTGVPADEQGPGWAYTIGRRHTRGEPELAMFGLGLPVMQSCLNILGERDNLTDGQTHDDVITSYPVRLRTVDPSWFRAFFGHAMWFYRRPPVPFLQVVWPARDGSFPWDNGSLAQPHLWLPPTDHPQGVWTQDI